jgi:small acid-soluble spore protein B (major beta-type SASP)
MLYIGGDTYMAGGQKNSILIPQARYGLLQLRNEVAKELGIPIPDHGYMGDIPSKLNGALGGHMVRRMIASAEQSLANSGTAGFAVGYKNPTTPGMSAVSISPTYQQPQWQ